MGGAAAVKNFGFEPRKQECSGLAPDVFLGSSAGLEHGKSVIRAFQRVDRCPGNRGSGRRQLFGRGEGVSGAGAEKRRRRDLRQVTVPRLVGFPGGWRG